MSDKWSGAAAVRYEKADGFDSAVVYKLSTRYAFTDTFALRGTYNTGFRTPTPGQQFTLNVTTTANANGDLVPSGTYPVSNPVAVALGAVPLTTEKSKNFTLGFAWDPLSNVSVTLDYYSIKIKDRIGLIPKVVTQSTVDILNANGYPNAQLLLGSAANFFGNAFDSKVTGVDFVVDTRHEIGSGTLNVDFRYNYNSQDVSHVKPGTLNASNIYDLEHQSPKNRSTLTFDYHRGQWDGLVRFNGYGSWSTTGGLFSPGDASDKSRYSGKVLVDLEATYSFNDTFQVSVGGDNVFNTHPDLEKDPTLRFLGVNYALTSPFGFNGAMWYVRGSVKF
jgi:iron complex outermembrane receptor protein